MWTWTGFDMHMVWFWTNLSPTNQFSRGLTNLTLCNKIMWAGDSQSCPPQNKIGCSLTKFDLVLTTALPLTSCEQIRIPPNEFSSGLANLTLSCPSRSHGLVLRKSALSPTQQMFLQLDKFDIGLTMELSFTGASQTHPPTNEFGDGLMNFVRADLTAPIHCCFSTSQSFRLHHNLTFSWLRPKACCSWDVGRSAARQMSTLCWIFSLPARSAAHQMSILSLIFILPTFFSTAAATALATTTNQNAKEDFKFVHQWDLPKWFIDRAIGEIRFVIDTFSEPHPACAEPMSNSEPITY